MLFHEIYGSYFNVVAAVLAEACETELTDRRLTEIVREKAFAESTVSLRSALKDGSWPLLDKAGRSVMHHKPTMPLTTLQKRWLKSLLSDPRIALFSPCADGLEEVRPLYAPDTFVFFDRYTDGDPYSDLQYVGTFRMALRAIREGRKMKIAYHGAKGLRRVLVCRPYRMEYSPKDDKFRLLCAGERRIHTVNMARIRGCELLEKAENMPQKLPREQKRELTLRLLDERNALERVLLHFSHFEKETHREEDGSYRLKLIYDREDETELLIRVLSFGPVLQVTAPEQFRELVHERLQSQLKWQQKSKEDEQ